MGTLSLNLNALIALAAFVISGCATPYQRKGVRGGYIDHDLGNGKYRIDFEGNGYTSSAETLAFALKRAKEICPEQGYSAYEIMDTGQAVAESRTPDAYQCSGNSTSTSVGSAIHTQGNAQCVNRGGQVTRRATSSVLVQCQAKGGLPAPKLSEPLSVDHDVE